MSKSITTIQELPLADAKTKAPAMFATEPAPFMSKKLYHFTPTIEIVNHMRDMGYVLTDAQQPKNTSPVRNQFGTHLITMQHPDLYVKNAETGDVEARPTILLINSHNGSRPIQFEMGMYRLICSNGLVVKSTDLGGAFRERHTKYDFTGVKQLIEQRLQQLPKTIERMNDWSGLEMTPKQRFNFAMKALELRMSDDRQADEHEIRSILTAKREGDEGTSLWKTFNVLQENLIKGGFQIGERQARPIVNISKSMEINQGLWSLAETIAG